MLPAAIKRELRASPQGLQHVLGVETSLDGFAKFDLFIKLKISQRKISFTRSVRGVVLIAAMSKSC